MKSKFFASVLVALSLIVGTVVPAFAAGTYNNAIILNVGKSTMLVNGEQKDIDSGKSVSPVIIDDTTMVPIRAIIEALGGNVEWNDSEEKVTISYKDAKVELWLDNNVALVNGTEAVLKIAPTTINDRMVLPLRFVSESLGLFVNWKDSSQAISITSSNDYVAVAGRGIVKQEEYNIYLAIAKNQVLDFMTQNNKAPAQGQSEWDVEIGGMKAGDLAKLKALNYSIQHNIFLTDASKMNLSLNDDEIASVNNSISSFIQQSGDESTADKKIMDTYNVSLAQYKDFIEKNKLIDKYIQSYLSQVEIPDNQVAQLYDQYKTNIDTVTVQHILISTLDSDGKEVSAEKQEEARKTAEGILAKVNAGEDFAALAKEYSSDPGSKDNGGIYSFTRGKMVKEFEDWSFNAKSGDTGIIKTAYGYHVMKFISRTSEDDIKSQIRQTLKNNALQTFMQKTVTDSDSVTVVNQSVYDSIKLD